MPTIVRNNNPPAKAFRIGVATKAGRPPEYPWQDMAPGDMAALEQSLKNVKQSLARWCKIHPGQDWRVAATDAGIQAWRIS